jgi:hypothetical protein
MLTCSSRNRLDNVVNVIADVESKKDNTTAHMLDGSMFASLGGRRSLETTEFRLLREIVAAVAARWDMPLFVAIITISLYQIQKSNLNSLF